MELEQRVKSLEYEMKILKNEIQRTLLDIQEQVLVHYYPALRTEEAILPPPLPTPQPVEAPRTIAVEPTPPAPAAPAAVPIVKTVSLEEARNLARSAPTEAPSTAPAPAPGDATQMSKLLRWALDSAAKIGSERMDLLIHLCSQRGIISQELQQVLASIAPINRRTPPEPIVAGDILRAILELDLLLGRPQDLEEALTLIEEAKIG